MNRETQARFSGEMVGHFMEKGHIWDKFAMVEKVANFMRSLPILPLTLFLIIPFTFLPIISSPHFPILSEAWAATYYVDATSGKDSNSGVSPEIPWKTIAKVNGSKFLPGDQILFKRGEGGSKVKPLFFN